MTSGINYSLFSILAQDDVINLVVYGAFGGLLFESSDMACSVFEKSLAR